MAQLISIEGGKSLRHLSLEQAWDKFLAANHKAKQTLQIEDGIAAGKAYADFIDLAGRTDRV